MGCGASTQENQNQAVQGQDKAAPSAESSTACNHEDAQCNKDAPNGEQIKHDEIQKIDPDGFAVASSEPVTHDSKEPTTHAAVPSSEPVTQDSEEPATHDSKEPNEHDMTPKSVLTEVQVAKLHQIFDIVDKNHDGTVTKKELLMALKKYPVVRTLFEISSDDVAAIQDDFEGQGRLGLAETSWSHMSLRGDLSVTWQEFMGHFAGNPQSALRGIELHQKQKTSESLECVERPKFVPTKDWQPVPKGAVCPKGLEYKMDLKSGATLARLC